MKKILTLALGMLFTPLAFAGTCEEKIGLAFTPNQRVALCRSFGSAINNSLIPSVTATYDLGTSALRWRAAFFSGTVATAGAVTAGTSMAATTTITAGTGVIATTGDITATAGDFIASASGKSISIQEGTSASACMGVSTPNGTTPVVVTTSCAIAGSRVFISRNAAIANLGIVTVTTSPNGTAFAYASTGVSDTAASSVVWFIVKESA